MNPQGMPFASYLLEKAMEEIYNKGDTMSQKKSTGPPATVEKHRAKASSRRTPLSD